MIANQIRLFLQRFAHSDKLCTFCTEIQGNSRDYIIQITSLTIVYMIVIVLYLSNCTIHRWRKHFCFGGVEYCVSIILLCS